MTTRTALQRLAQVAIMAVVLASGGIPAAEPDGLLDGFQRAHVVIETRRACLFLDVYVALTNAQRAQGLMHVRRLDEYEGMVFPTEEPRIASMWMKDTYIPLDMLFIQEDGQVVRIAANTTPLSETSVSSKIPVVAVLEVGGGFSARHGIAVRDRVMLFD